MLLSVEPNNFRKLPNRKFKLLSGMNAIRGLNEAGKSSLFEAVSYVISGVDGLRESLEHVVTWGAKESSLWVKLELQINNDVYFAKRGKSGAEVQLNGKVVCTGQKEVTAYLADKLGAHPKILGKLMIATQKSLQGALEDGPTATAALIEKLSNFSLIDEVIQLVIENLPSGSAAPLEQQIATLGSQLEGGEPGELDESEGIQALADTESKLNLERAELVEAQEALQPAKEAADAARKQARELENARRDLAGTAADLEHAKTTLASLNPVSSVKPGVIEALRKQVEDASKLAMAGKAYSALQVARPETTWEGTRAEFNSTFWETRKGLEEAQHARATLHTKLVEARAMVITETQCAFCKKDLTDVPEVTAHNHPLWEQIDRLNAEISSAELVVSGLRQDIAAYEAIEAADREWAKLYAKHAQYIELIDNEVPPTFKWIGPDLSKSIKAPVEELAAAESENTRAARDQGRKQNFEERVVALTADKQRYEGLIKELEPKVKADRSVSFEIDLQRKVDYHTTRVRELAQGIRELTQSMQHARQMHQFKVDKYREVKSLYETAQATLEELQLNNVLLKKLRAARPKVADKLWNTLQATISYYFSEIRGAKSVITRDENGFKCDGKPVTGLSGSTLDSLGLAIRIALTKTFLPNNDFLVVDEPAAACDPEREARMLGVIMTAGFAQVLLITHSELADAFADQVISL